MTRVLRSWLFGSRPYIALHYLFTTALGIFLGSKIFDKPIEPIQSILIGLSIFFAFQASIVLNDISDVKSDDLGKRKTPLNSGLLSEREYQIFGVIFFVVSFVIALLLSYRILLIVLLGHTFHFIYSCYPFRLKRFYPLSIFILAICALFTAIAGYALYEPAKPFISFPLKAALFIVIPLFLGLNFRDLADYEGDKNTNVTTLFTWLGTERARKVNAGLIFLSYILVPIILQYSLLFFATVPLGLMSLYYCLKVPFEEKFIFYIYFVLIIILTILFNLNPAIIVTQL